MGDKDDVIVPAYQAQVRWVVDAGPPDVLVVRGAARATAHNWGVDVVADNVALVVGELAANAWIHGRPPIVVLLRLEGSAVLVEVSDAGPGIAEFSWPRSLGVHGYGLPITASLADELGLYANSAGKTVWARLRFQWGVPPEDEMRAA
jgi:anti-sigma regulatory factor (Ser/Thr protein kinase)